MARRTQKEQQECPNSKYIGQRIIGIRRKGRDQELKFIMGTCIRSYYDVKRIRYSFPDKRTGKPAETVYKDQKWVIRTDDGRELIFNHVMLDDSEESPAGKM